MDTRWLKARGIDAKSIHDYVARGWLERIIRGVYRRPLPETVQVPETVPWDSALLSLQRIMEYDLHLGGVSALDLAGYAHYLHLGGAPRIHLYGNAPSWLKRLPSDAQIIVHRRTLFGDDRTGITDSDRDARESSQSVNVWHWPLKASSPERAVLEALDELCDDAGFEKLNKVFESLTTLRPKQLMALLIACQSVKVRRLFFVFADRHKHAWHKYLDADQVNFGSGPRVLVKGGKTHPTYRIYVPENFIPENGTGEQADA